MNPRLSVKSLFGPSRRWPKTFIDDISCLGALWLVEGNDVLEGTRVASIGLMIDRDASLPWDQRGVLNPELERELEERRRQKKRVTKRVAGGAEELSADVIARIEKRLADNPGMRFCGYDEYQRMRDGGTMTVRRSSSSGEWAPGWSSSNADRG